MYLGAALLASLTASALWLRPSALEGRYESVGVNVLADGSTLTSYHSIAFTQEGFYAVTRLGNTEVETSGSLDYRFPNGYRLTISQSLTAGDLAALEDNLRFNLTYTRHIGASIELKPVAGCLYSPQTQQLYCQSAP